MGYWQAKVYPNLPVSLQNVAISAFGYSWKKRRYGGIFQEQLKGFKARETWNASRWREYQTLKLRSLLLHAFEAVPYYNDKLKQSGFAKHDLEKFELEDLQRLPCLEKATLKKFGRNSLL